MHLSAEELSEVAEGRQEGAQAGVGPASDVTAHLRDCARCRDEADAVADLLAALADLERPTVPQDVAARIDAALADAARADAASTVDSRRDGAAHPVADRPPSRSPETRRPASRGSSSRRSLRRVAGWSLGSLALVGAVAGLATVISSQNGATSHSDASAGSAAARNPENPALQNGIPKADSSAQSELVTWTRSVLSAATSSAGSSGGHANSLSTAPTSSFTAASVSQCEADPAFAGRRVVGSASGLLGATPAVLIVYANGDGSPSVYAVAYAAPCAASNYHVLAEETVPE